MRVRMPSSRRRESKVSRRALTRAQHRWNSRAFCIVFLKRWCMQREKWSRTCSRTIFSHSRAHLVAGTPTSIFSTVRPVSRTKWHLPTPFDRRSKTGSGFSASLLQKRCDFSATIAEMAENQGKSLSAQGFGGTKSDVARREEETLAWWKERGIFKKTLAKPAPKGEFVFYEGPPTANGLPGIHHLESRAFKDAIPRYR